jgi:hypothetical protein
MKINKSRNEEPDSRTEAIINIKYYIVFGLFYFKIDPQSEYKNPNIGRSFPIVCYNKVLIGHSSKVIYLAFGVCRTR